VLSGSSDKTVKLWDAATGALLRTFEGHSDGVTSVAFSAYGRRVVSTSRDDTMRIWDSATGAQLATLMGGRDGEWLAMTPKGFFAASPNGTEMLAVVRGRKGYSVMQFYRYLYRPDLVEEALKGDRKAGTRIPPTSSTSKQFSKLARPPRSSTWPRRMTGPGTASASACASREPAAASATALSGRSTASPRAIPRRRHWRRSKTIRSPPPWSPRR
jgi:WD40 repeat protein